MVLSPPQMRRAFCQSLYVRAQALAPAALPCGLKMCFIVWAWSISKSKEFSHACARPSLRARRGLGNLSRVPRRGLGAERAPKKSTTFCACGSTYEAVPLPPAVVEPHPLGRMLLNMLGKAVMDLLHEISCERSNIAGQPVSVIFFKVYANPPFWSYGTVRD